MFCLSLSSPPLFQEAGFIGFMRSLRGRDQEKVGKKKEELWGWLGWGEPVVALWPQAQRGPISTDVGDLKTSAKGYFWYCADHVCYTSGVTYRQTTFFFFSLFSLVLWWTKQKSLIKTEKQNRVFAQILWLHLWKRHLTILYLCNTAPCLPNPGYLWKWCLVVWGWRRAVLVIGIHPPTASYTLYHRGHALAFLALCVLLKRNPIQYRYTAFSPPQKNIFVQNCPVGRLNPC